MVKIGKTRTKKPRSRSQKFKKAVLGRPQVAIQKRVQAVGPEKFGIVAVDCAKARSKWMLTDFYGNILNPPTNVEHDRSSFQLAILTLKQAGQKGITRWLDDAKIRFHKATIERVVVWAANATEPDPMAIFHTRVWMSQLDDWTQKTQQIHAIERELAGIFVKTPYVLLLPHPGINVVTAAELGGEMGPLKNYASARAVCGRAGLFPSRYQSDEVDRTGKLTRFRNAKLGAAWIAAT